MPIVPQVIYHNGSVISPLLDKITHFIDDPTTYGAMLEWIWISMLCLSDDPIDPGSESLLQAHLTARQQPTFCRLYRKHNRLDIVYTSSFRHREDKFSPSALELNRKDTLIIKSELIGVLLLLKKKVKSTDEFDIARWVSDLERAKAELAWTTLLPTPPKTSMKKKSSSRMNTTT